MRREYESGMQWCVWRWKDIYWKGNLYLRRLHIFQCPLFAIMLHWIQDIDRQKHMHDHPVSMISFVLRGWYTETRWNVRKGTRSYHSRNWVNWIPSRSIHKITNLPHEGCVTLVICGWRERSWGFYTKNGWIPWREYHDLYGGETS